jgi:hypothetical protein
LGSVPNRRTIPPGVVDAAITRFLAGETVAALAKEYGIAEINIYGAMKKAGIALPKRPFTEERLANMSAGLRRRYAARPAPPHPPDCTHCLAVRGVPKPPRTQLHRDRISAARRAMFGDPSDYTTAHFRIRRDRGRAREHACVSCGRAAVDWALKADAPTEWLRSNGRLWFSIRTSDYEAKCRACHYRDDSARRRPHQ